LHVDGIDHLFAPDFKHNFAPPLRPGLAGFKDIGRMMNQAFRNVVVTEQDLIANDTTEFERSSAAATHKGEFMGTAPTGVRSVGQRFTSIVSPTESSRSFGWSSACFSFFNKSARFLPRKKNRKYQETRNVTRH
jgi:SnoaL-like polyketide cyclase